MLDAEALVGRRVTDAAGHPVGLVLDVGVGEQRLPKFLLVAPTGETRGLVRVEMRDVQQAGEGILRVRALPA